LLGKSSEYTSAIVSEGIVEDFNLCMILASTVI